MDGLMPDNELNDINGDVSEDSVSDEEVKNDCNLIEEINISDRTADAHLLHINEQFEDIDLIEEKCDTTFQIPSSDLINDIVKQVEYYFSDENIVKDDYLLKFIRQSKTEFVNLKIISNFKRMKKLTKSCEVVAHAIEKASTKLVLDKNKKRVKRIAPLPEIPHRDFGDATRVVLATTLPSLSVDSLRELFLQCGHVTKIEIVEQESNLPESVKAALSYVKASMIPFALVEYELPESASKASKVLTNNSDWRRGIRVEVLTKFFGKAVTRDKENKVLGTNADNQAKVKHQTQQQPSKKKKKPANKRPTSNLDRDKVGSPSPVEKKGVPIPCSTKRRDSPSHSSSLGSSPMKIHQHGMSPLADPDGDGLQRARSNSFGDSQVVQPWQPRRLQEAGGREGANVQKNLESYRATHVGTLRNPRIPDNGTKGFAISRTLP